MKANKDIQKIVKYQKNGPRELEKASNNSHNV